MLLAVPHIRQLTSKDCGIAVCESLLQFHSLPVSRKSLLSCLPRHSYGNSLVELAECLFNHGLQTTLISATAYTDATQQNKRQLQSALEAGVYLKIKAPSLKLIKDELEHKRPVIASVNRSLSPETEIQFHYVIVTGITEEKVTLMDPASPRTTVTLDTNFFEACRKSIQNENPFVGSILFAKAKHAQKHS